MKDADEKKELENKNQNNNNNSEIRDSERDFQPIVEIETLEIQSDDTRPIIPDEKEVFES